MNGSVAIERHPLSAVLFDLDGTLLDTAPDFVSVVNRMLIEDQRATLPFDIIRAGVSNGTRGLVRLAFELEEHADEFEPRRRRMLELYERNLLNATRPFPGMAELLKTIGRRGLKWGVVTNKPHYLAEPLLQGIALDPSFSVLICPDHVRRTKPDPEPLLLACERMATAVDEVIYIGDHRRDIEAGRGAGMRTVAAAYGYLEADESAADWNADFIADSVADIGTLLERHFLAPGDLR
jgi:N-acetyl-D-muramate 6-phosphate phosphatase